MIFPVPMSFLVLLAALLLLSAVRDAGFPFLLTLLYTAFFSIMLYVSTLEADLIHVILLITLFQLVLIYLTATYGRCNYASCFMILQCVSIFFNIIFCLCYIYANQAVWDLVANSYEVTNNALIFADCLMLLGITYGDTKRIDNFSA
jgi:hypothetical protein